MPLVLDASWAETDSTAASVQMERAAKTRSGQSDAVTGEKRLANPRPDPSPPPAQRPSDKGGLLLLLLVEIVPPFCKAAAQGRRFYRLIRSEALCWMTSASLPPQSHRLRGTAGTKPGSFNFYSVHAEPLTSNMVQLSSWVWGPLALGVLCGEATAYHMNGMIGRSLSTSVLGARTGPICQTSLGRLVSRGLRPLQRSLMIPRHARR